jgi:hypothetical protein
LLKNFKPAKKSRGELNAETPAELLAAAADFGAAVPILCRVIHVSSQGCVVVIGRNLRAIETLA